VPRTWHFGRIYVQSLIAIFIDTTSHSRRLPPETANHGNKPEIWLTARSFGKPSREN